MKLRCAVGSIAILALWPWLTFSALGVFQISMRRAKVNGAHVLRCVLYSFDVLLWVGAFSLAETAGYLIVWLARGNWPLPMEISAWAALGVGLFGVFRLWAAYRDYLHFHAPLATVLAAQAVVAVLVPTMMVALRVVATDLHF